MPHSGKLLGMTTSIPVEVALAAGLTPVDLNNKFISHPQAHELIRAAEETGLPRTLCAWIKGMYAWCLRHPELETIVAVTQGDCSNTHALAELLSHHGRRVISFEYPHQRDAAALADQIQRLARALGADLDQAEQWRRRLLPLRRQLALLDELTWRQGLISGAENQQWLVCSSDFEGDPDSYGQALTRFLAQAGQRPETGGGVRIGVLGVPPIFDDLAQAVEAAGGRVVFNETPRQYAMPPGPVPPASLVEQYLAYTYPYDVWGRIADIKAQAALRGLDGLIHYTQTFCYRQMQDVLIKEMIDLPVLTLEGDAVGPVDGRVKVRIEAFIEMLS